MSTKPGVTSSPSASSTRRAGPDTRPSSAMRPSASATSAVRAGAPVPSTTVPPRITRSNGIRSDSSGVEGEPQAGLRPGRLDQEPAPRDGDPGGLHVLAAEGDVRDQGVLVLGEREELHLALGRDGADAAV